MLNLVKSRLKIFDRHKKDRELIFWELVRYQSNLPEKDTSVSVRRRMTNLNSATRDEFSS